ncbi:alpha/beta hydrolase [Nicoliella spurrieriana]|uniref:Alpha/beta hydrolase n=1 Tax=Nicoliella spurrieriana TaxID=2925830 RepID=A0A976X5P6_9LACO|nr:alpha/beta hydrolase [Nicoliella spurrieriana]UQS86879.1 alpha/beta hydrolase [Nicoliella spurrieriana]
MQSRRSFIMGFMFAISIIEKYTAFINQRSLRAQLVNQILPLIPVIRPLNTNRKFQQAMQNSKLPYQVPRWIQCLGSVHQYHGQSAIFEIVPHYVQAANHVIFYLHGGAYLNPPTLQHYQLLTKLANQTGWRVIMPVYPKTPAYHARDAHAMVMDAYQQLLNDDTIDSITLMGDSAGAGLGLALMQRIRDQKMQLPAKAVLISPYLDISNSNQQMRNIQPRDPMLNIATLAQLGLLYADGISVKDPLVSPIYGDATGLPAILMVTGTDDILSPDAMRFQKMAVSHHWEVTTIRYQAMNHDFMLFPIPEARDALHRVIQFIQKVSLRA